MLTTSRTRRSSTLDQAEISKTEEEEDGEAARDHVSASEAMSNANPTRRIKGRLNKGPLRLAMSAVQFKKKAI